MEARHATESDLDGYAAVQEEEWDGGMAASRAQLGNRFATFPEGVLVGEHESKVVAGASFVRLISYDLREGRSWNELTGSGWGSSHVPDGSVMFGVDLSVSRHAPRSASAQMFMAGLELTMDQGVDGLYWGSRLPRYHKYADRMTANEYIQATNSRGRHLDPELQIYSRIPGLEVLGAVADYFDDWESCDYGAILHWRNPIRGFPLLRPFSEQVLALLYRRRN